MYSPRVAEIRHPEKLRISLIPSACSALDKLAFRLRYRRMDTLYGESVPSRPPHCKRLVEFFHNFSHSRGPASVWEYTIGCSEHH
jgi:hypothetical protein